MPYPRGIGHKIIAGSGNLAAMAAATPITGFPKQSAQLPVQWWAPWSTNATTTPNPKRISRVLSGSQQTDGYLEVEWTFSIWTFEMLAYWNTQFLGATAWSAPVTIQTYDDSNTLVTLTALLNRANMPADGTPVPGGYMDIHHKFTRGVLVLS